MVRKSKRTCYIVSSWKIDISPLVYALEKRNVTITRAEHTSPQFSIADGIRDQIRDAEFVIGVLGRPQDNTNVYYEIGLAHGLDKRVLLFSTEPTLELPFNLEQLYIVRSALSNSDAIDFSIDQILSAPPLTEKRRSNKSKSTSKPLGNRATEFLNRLNNLSQSGAARQLEELVSDLLKACAVDVVAESLSKDTGADFAIWSDELEPTVGNPLIVEVKQTLEQKSDIANVGKEIAKYLTNTGRSWVILLYQNGIEAGNPIWTKLPPTVLVFRLDELILQLRDTSLPDVVRIRRNQIAHGGVS
jgi:hypothetical protein